WIKKQEGVENAQARITTSLKLVLPDASENNIILISYPDFNDIKLNLLELKEGSWPPTKGGLFLERNSFKQTGLSLGQYLKLRKSNGTEFDVALSGVIYDNSAIPYMFTNQMTGFISWNTVSYLDIPRQFNTIDISTKPEIRTLPDVENLVFNLSHRLEDKGVRVNSSNILPPNEHWAEDNSRAFTAILSVIGVFSLILSGFLVINTISAILTQQKKQIGVMRAVGGKRKQIINLYLTTVAVYGVLALLTALPVGMFLGYVFLSLITDFLNLDVNVFYLPIHVLLMQIVAALAVPVIAALYPIIQGSKKPINTALSDYQPTQKTNKFELLLFKIKGLPRPLLISIRNTFRKAGRLTLTLGTLIVAGAVFIAVVNVRSSMYLELDRILQMFDFEVSINLNQAYDTQSLIKRIGDIENIQIIEARSGLRAKRIKPDGTKGNDFAITGLPPETAFSHPVILSGRWLNSDDKEQIVLSSGYIRDNQDLSVGDTIEVSFLDNESKTLEIVGIVAMSGRQQIGFMEFNELSLMKKEPRAASSYLIKTNPKDSITQQRVLEMIVNKLERTDFVITNKETRNQIFSSSSSQFNFLIFFLLTMAVMIASVGGLGLAGTMSLNVMERTREIGIMRSVGAGNKIISQVVLSEGVAIGFLSFLLSIPLSIPITLVLCYAIGTAFF
ncbi:FtsX-like permease family protein, partial [Patescibacteria group bacterium]